MRYYNLLKDYVECSNVLYDKVINLSNEIILFKPSIEGAWSIKEHIIHIVDSEINNFIRWKSIIAQPGSKCFVIEENEWTKNLKYEQEDIKDYLDVLKLLRKITFNYLLNVDEAEWNKNYFIHEYEGKINKITLEKIIEIYKEHIYWHINYIERNIVLQKEEIK